MASCELKVKDYLLSGLKVVDCATVIAAPAAAMILADFGADIVKIEQPGEGDMLRMLAGISGFETDSNWFWELDGRNKRSIALDLKSEEGIDVLRKLVEGCDVFITNQPYGVRESLGLTYELLRPLNESMIYASLTAYGEKGPERDRKGFDQLAYWARSGLMDLMRAPDTRPTQGLPGMGDHPTGVALYAGIMTALLHRERTGEGGLVHTSLLANGLWSASGIAQGVMAGGDSVNFRSRSKDYSAMMCPYQTKDSRWLQFNMIRNEELLSILLTALDALHLLADERFSTPELMFENRALLSETIQEIIISKDARDWLELFEEFELPVNLVGLVEETKDDRQVLENKMAVVPDDESMETGLVINHPIQVSSVEQVGPKRAPGLGEHGSEILRELGYEEHQIESMKGKGVIG